MGIVVSFKVEYSVSVTSLICLAKKVLVAFNKGGKSHNLPVSDFFWTLKFSCIMP